MQEIELDQNEMSQELMNFDVAGDRSIISVRSVTMSSRTVLTDGPALPSAANRAAKWAASTLSRASSHNVVSARALVGVTIPAATPYRSSLLRKLGFARVADASRMISRKSAFEVAALIVRDRFT